MAFYKKTTDGTLLTAPNYVSAPEYELFATEKNNYNYPVHGWLWFDTEELAMAALGFTQVYNVDGWKSQTCNLRIVAPVAMVNENPMLLYNLAVVRKLQLENENDMVHIYCNHIDPEHQQLIDASNGLITIQTRQLQ